MKKDITITSTRTNNYINFKCRLPLEWLVYMGITEKDKKITIFFENNKLYIKKCDDCNLNFKELSKEKKFLQLKKYEYLNSHKYISRKDLIADMEDYFDLSYRTIYRLLKQNVDLKLLDEVDLIEKQKKNTSNIHVMFIDIKGYVVPVITIPTTLGILLKENKNYKKLGIKSASELYEKNTSFIVEIKLNKKTKTIILQNKKNN